MKKRKLTVALCLILATLLVFAACKKEDIDPPNDDSQDIQAPSGGEENAGGNGTGGGAGNNGEGTGGGAGNNNGEGTGGGGAPADEIKPITTKTWLSRNFSSSDGLMSLTLDEKNGKAELSQKGMSNSAIAKGSYIYKDGYVIIRIDEIDIYESGTAMSLLVDYRNLSLGYVTGSVSMSQQGQSISYEVSEAVIEKDGILYDKDQYGRLAPVTQEIQMLIAVDKIDGQYAINTVKPISVNSRDEFFVITQGQDFVKDDYSIGIQSVNGYYSQLYPEETVDTANAGSGRLTYKLGPVIYEIPYYIVPSDASAELSMAYYETGLQPPFMSEFDTKGMLTVKKGGDTSAEAFAYTKYDSSDAQIGEPVSVTFAQLGINTEKTGVQTVIYNIEGVPTAISVYVFEEGERVLSRATSFIVLKDSEFDPTAYSVRLFNYNDGTISTVPLTAEMLTFDTSVAGEQTVTLTIDGVEYKAHAYVYEAGEKKVVSYYVSGLYDMRVVKGEKIDLSYSSVSVRYEFLNYDTGASEENDIQLTEDMISLDTSKAGWTTMTVTPEEGITLTYSIYVIEKSDVLNFSFVTYNSGEPYITIFEGDCENFPADRIVLYIDKGNYSRYQLVGEDALPYIIGIENVDLKKTGTYYIYALVDGYTQIFEVNVTAPPAITTLSGTSGDLTASTLSDTYSYYLREFAIYELTITEYGEIFFEGTGTGLDSYGILFDSNFELLDEDDDGSSNGNNFLISSYQDAGTYYLAVGLLNGTSDSIPFTWSFTAS